MAFKSKAEIFGDNGANGTKVPVSESAPTGGYDADNRGVGFGEGVTAAIANRTGYALADNTDDLNARVADIETNGLDAAYRGGLGATPGSGRVVTVDGGAVEAAGTATLDDEANALLRARVFSGDVGLDVVGSSFGAILNRIPLALNNNTVLPASTAAVLNPAGAGVDLVEVTGPQRFATTADTDLILGFDFLQIAGTASNDGLYAIVAVTTDFRVQVAALNPALPSFPVTTAATITLHRAATRIEDGSLYLTPTAGGATAAAVDVVSDTAATLSPGAAIRASVAQVDGSTAAVFEVDRDGGTEITFDNTNRSGAELRNLAAALSVEVTTSRSDSEASPTVVVRGPGVDVLDLVPVAGASLQWPEFHLAEYRLSFTGAPPANWVALPATVDLAGTTNRVDFQASALNVINAFMNVSAMVRLSNTAGGTYDGYYHVVGFDTTGNGRVYLREVNGDIPAFAAGTATLQLFYLDQYHAGGVAPRSITYNVATAPHAEIFDVNTTLDIAHQYYGDTMINGALIVGQTDVPVTAANPHAHRPVFAVDPEHSFWQVFAKNLLTRGDLSVTDGTDTATLQVASGTLDVVNVPMRVAQTLTAITDFSVGNGDSVLAVVGGTTLTLSGAADNLRVGGDLEVGSGGESSLSVVGGTVLTLSGAADNLKIDGDLEVDGTANFDGTADFDGIVDMSSTVQLSGASNEVTYASTRSRTVRVEVANLRATVGSVLEFPSLDTAHLKTDGGYYFIDVSSYLPSGCVLQEVHARVDPGNGRSGTDRMQLTVSDSTGSPSTGSLGSEYDNTFTVLQTISVTGINHTVNRATTGYLLQIKSGNTASTQTDQVYWFSLVFDDVGPRNF